MKVVGIIGSKAAGKETIALHIAKKYGGIAHSHSEILDDVLKALRLPITRDNQIKLVALRKTFGPEVLPNALNKKLKNENAPLEIVTGIRFDSELQNIRSYPQNVLIYVDAPAENRFSWAVGRKQKRAQSIADNFEHFLEYESKETEVHIRELGKQADFKIENSGTLQDLLAAADKIMDKILEKNSQ